MDSLSALLAAGCSADGVAAASSNAFLSAIDSTLTAHAATSSSKFAAYTPSFPPNVQHMQHSVQQSPQNVYKVMPKTPDYSSTLQSAWRDTASSSVSDVAGAHAEPKPSAYMKHVLPNQVRQIYSPPVSAPAAYSSDVSYAYQTQQLHAWQQAQAHALAQMQSESAARQLHLTAQPLASVATSQDASSLNAAATHTVQDGELHAAMAFSGRNAAMPTAAELRQRLNTLDNLWKRVHGRTLDGLSGSDIGELFDTAASEASHSAMRQQVHHSSTGLFDDLATPLRSQPLEHAERLPSALPYTDARTYAHSTERDTLAEEVERAVRRAWDASTELLHSTESDDLAMEQLLHGDAGMLKSDVPSSYTLNQLEETSKPALKWAYSLGDPALNPLLSQSQTEQVHYSSAETARNAETSASEMASNLIDSLWQRAVTAYTVGIDLQHTAIPACEAVLHLLPEHSDAWRLLGDIHAELDNDHAAIACFHHAVNADPYNRAALLSLGVSLVNEGAVAAAASAFEAWLRADPRFHDVAVPVASLSADPHADGSALDTVTRLLLTADAATASTEPELAEALGVLFNAAGDYRAAIRSFQAALQAHHTVESDIRNTSMPARLHNRIGATHAHAGQHEDALTSYASATALRPSFARAQLNAAISHSAVGQKRAAVDGFVRTLTLNPTIEHVWSLLRREAATFPDYNRGALLDACTARDLTATRSISSVIRPVE